MAGDTSTKKAGGGTDLRPAYLVRGDDASLVGQAALELVTSLVGDEGTASSAEDHGGAGADIDVGAVVDALATPPFISDRRVVVVRDAGRLGAADAARLVACLDDPVPGVALVIVAGGGTVPAALIKAVQRVGTVVDASVGTGRARSQWLAEQLRGAPVRFDARAAATVGEHLGNDLARLPGLLDMLAAAYGDGESIDDDRLAPFLGEAGSVAPWDLTDALDRGDTPAAMEALARMLGAGGFHPLAVLGVLHRHFGAMLRLDGSSVSSPEQAVEVLGTRSVYPAKKALEQSRRLGAARLGRAVSLLAGADLDLRGRTALDGVLVLEVLVARLSRLGLVRDSAPRARRQSAPRRSTRSGTPPR